jgi:hypothetical protein
VTNRTVQHNAALTLFCRAESETHANDGRTADGDSIFVVIYLAKTHIIIVIIIIISTPVKTSNPVM